MGKGAINVAEQIKLLRKRGMTINDEDKAREVLLDVGYYRLGFYWFPFESSYPNKKCRTHEFRQGTNFDHIVKLYYFDFNLRNILTKYLNRIEINFRTRLTYHVSNKHKNSPTWFTDPKIVSAEYIQRFNEIVYSRIKLNPAIQHHHKTHPDSQHAPAWKTIEFMTLGEVIYLFKAIKEEKTKRDISQHLSIRQLPILENYLAVIRTIRNHCAHGNILYDIALPTPIRRGPAGSMSESNYPKLHGALKVIYYMTGVVSKNRQNDLKTELTALFKKYHEVPEVQCIIKNATGIENVDEILG